MNRHERGLEFKVGIFVFAGLAMLGALVVQFGRLGEGFKTYYALTIQFSDASGLLKGSDVLLAGARIGKVSGGPRLVREGNGVAVPLKIYDYVKIPEGSKFTVGSSGLLGDRFVNVTCRQACRNFFYSQTLTSTEHVRLASMISPAKAARWLVISAESSKRSTVL